MHRGRGGVIVLFIIIFIIVCLFIFVVIYLCRSGIGNVQCPLCLWEFFVCSGCYVCAVSLWFSNKGSPTLPLRASTAPPHPSLSRLQDRDAGGRWSPASDLEELKANWAWRPHEMGGTTWVGTAQKREQKRRPPAYADAGCVPRGGRLPGLWAVRLSVGPPPHPPHHLRRLPPRHLLPPGGEGGAGLRQPPHSGRGDPLRHRVGPRRLNPAGLGKYTRRVLLLVCRCVSWRNTTPLPAARPEGQGEAAGSAAAAAAAGGVGGGGGGGGGCATPTPQPQG